MQPRDMTYRQGLLARAAKAADAFENRNTLIGLERAVRDLEKAVRLYEHLLAEYHREVGYFIAAVHQAQTLAATKPEPVHPDELAEEARANLIAQSEIGLDRAAALYGLPKPKRRR
jgi:hypothetical protein